GQRCSRSVARSWFDRGEYDRRRALLPLAATAVESFAPDRQDPVRHSRRPQALFNVTRTSRLLLRALLTLVATRSVLHGQVAGVHREIYTNLTREAFSLARLTNHPNFLIGRPDQT